MTDDILSLSPVAEAALEALATFRYLTPAQMLDAGVCRDRRHLYDVLPKLMRIAVVDGKRVARPKEIGELDFGVEPARSGYAAGRRSRVYYLTALGAELLALARPDVGLAEHTKRPTMFDNDYWHRVRTVDFHIALSKWAQDNDQEILRFETYYDWSGISPNGIPQPRTRIHFARKSLEPDAIFQLQDTNGSIRTFAFEMANGMRTGHVTKKIVRYCEALEHGAINDALELGSSAVRVLFVFEHPKNLELVQQRLCADRRVSAWHPHFFLKCHGELFEGSLIHNWQRLSSTNPDQLFAR